MKISNIQFKVFTVFIFFTTFVFSLCISPFHINGDQAHYNEAYYSIQGLSLIDAWLKYSSIVYTGEPIHFIIVWFCSFLGFDKHIVMAFSNSLLAILFSRYLFDKKFNLFLVFLILISNYYLLTMFFTLERTKFAFIFFLFAIIYRNFFLILISIFTHSIILFPTIAYQITKSINYGKIQIKSFFNNNSSKFPKLRILIFILLGFIVWYFLQDHLVSKFNSYFFIDFEIYQIIIIFILSYFSCVNKNEVFVFFTFIIISIIILGGDRLNMLGYFAFIHFGNNKNKLFKIFILVLISYYSIKSILYINMIITTGG